MKTANLVSFLLGAGLALLLTGPAGAQTDAQTGTRYRPPGPAGAMMSDPASVAAANANTVGIVSGGVDGTYVRIAADLASVLDDGDKLRVLPMIGKGSVQNVADILYLRGIDVGIVQSDVLAYIEQQKLYPNVQFLVGYVAKLYDEEVHVLARKDIAQLSDLAHRKVNVDVTGSGTAMTASVLFGNLGIPVQATHDDQDAALEKLRRGDIAAIVYVVGKPARLFTAVPADTGLHFLSIPINQALLDTYLPAQLRHADYPALIAAGAPVNTVAVGAVMAVYNWPPNTERYRKVARFVDAFFSKFHEFQQPPRHPKWKDVNLAAQLPGWTRFPPAQQWLERAAVAGTAGGTVQAEFSAFVSSAAGSATGLNDAQKTRLFRQFLRWENTRQPAQ